MYEAPEIPTLSLNKVASYVETEREKRGQDEEIGKKIDPSTIAFNQFVD